jgi:hypothetical protein
MKGRDYYLMRKWLGSTKKNKRRNAIENNLIECKKFMLVVNNAIAEDQELNKQIRRKSGTVDKRKWYSMFVMKCVRHPSANVIISI